MWYTECLSLPLQPFKFTLVNQLLIIHLAAAFRAFMALPNG